MQGLWNIINTNLAISLVHVVAQYQPHPRAGALMHAFTEDILLEEE